jgi:hypothetical protein
MLNLLGRESLCACGVRRTAGADKSKASAGNVKAIA